MLLEGLGASLQAVGTLGWIGARGAKDGATARQDTAHGREIEFHGLVFQQPAPALHESHKVVFIVEGTLTHHCANYSIQSGAVASAGQHSNLHRLLLI